MSTATCQPQPVRIRAPSTSTVIICLPSAIVSASLVEVVAGGVTLASAARATILAQAESVVEALAARVLVVVSRVEVLALVVDLEEASDATSAG